MVAQPVELSDIEAVDATPLKRLDGNPADGGTETTAASLDKLTGLEDDWVWLWVVDTATEGMAKPVWGEVVLGKDPNSDGAVEEALEVESIEDITLPDPEEEGIWGGGRLSEDGTPLTWKKIKKTTQNNV